MKNKVLVMLLIFTIVCMLFAFVACKDPNETPSGDIPSGEVGSGDQNPPSGEISSGDNNQDGSDNEQGGNGDLISAYKNFKGEEIDYSLYFKTDGNGKIIGLSDYAIEKREEIIQLEIPEKIGDEDITALSITFESLPYLRSLIIPESIQTIEETINPGNIFSFHVIYCEASSKPQGWCADWIQENLIMMYDTKVKFSAVVWDCKNNEIADDGKVYCFAPSGILYALKDSQAELAFSGKSDVEDLELASEVKYRNDNFALTGFYPLAFISTDLIKEEWLFQNNKNLKSVKIPNGVTSISFGAFYGCINLTSIEIPNSVTHIGKWAFHSCINLTDIEIPNSVTTIDNGAFYYCSSLTSIEIPSSVTTIGDMAFSYCSILTSIDIPSGVTSIGEGAFEYCSSLTNIEIQSGVTSIGNSVFRECSSLTSIVIPSSVTSIGDQAFSYCSSLTSIVIPSSVTSIGDRAFSSCSSLTSIEIPSSVTSVGFAVFSSCSSLTIYCEAESQPSGWDSWWNPSDRPVVWGYKG